MKMNSIVRASALCLALTASALQVQAQSASPTLKKIADAGTISLGHRES